MTKVVKFIYAIILFFSLFLLSSGHILSSGHNGGQPCQTDENCPFSMMSANNQRIIFKCVNKICTKFVEVHERTC
ncbi:unnamed protein product [Lathyrus oleraceus]